MMSSSVSGEPQDLDPYWLGLVKAELNSRTSGTTVHVSFIHKNLPKLGDCAAIALLKLIDTSETVSSGVVAASLSIIMDAFAQPERIALKVDREPKVTLCLLSMLCQSVQDKKILNEIEKVREIVKHKAAE